MRPLPRRRAGFTLIELLMVIAIIMILATATLGIYKGVTNTRMKARGRGEIQRIVIACENFKKVYGDFPCANQTTSASNAANQTSYRTDLFDQLSGRRVLYNHQLTTGGFAVELWPYNSNILPNGTSRKMKPFITLDDITVYANVSSGTPTDAKPADLANINATLDLRDPWGNPYEYRYRILGSINVSIQNLTTGGFTGNYAAWMSSNFVLVSCGPNFAAPKVEGGQPEFLEYFDPSGTSPMVKSGIIPATYFDDTDPAPLRSDNLVNWAN
jgi:prepilin-type N-terminal cleavage/methylation domain-containing protein